MLLGLIGILILAFHQTKLTMVISERLAKWGVQNPSDPTEILPCSANQLVAVFEKVHLGIVGTMGIYFATCVWLLLWHWMIYHHWNRFDFEPFDGELYQQTLQEHRSDSFLRYLKIPRLVRLWRMRAIDRLHALRASCIDQYGLPQDFQFSWYFKLAMRDVVIQILSVNPLCWALLILAFGFQFVRLALFRIDNSQLTITIYGVISLFLAAIAGLVYFVASRIYIKVLNLASVKRHLKISVQKFGGDFEFPGSDELSPLDSGPSSIHVTSGRNTYDENAALLRSASMPTLQPIKSRSPTNTTGASSSGFAAAMEAENLGDYGMNGGDQDISLEQQVPEHLKADPIFDGIQHTFQDTASGRAITFNVFSRPVRGTLSIMTVAEYREKSTLVSNILRRAQVRTADDTSHANMLFFKSRRFLVSALQFLVFIQAWVLGLSIYYTWSIYHDQPVDIPKHPSILVFPFIGPILTYAIMGIALEKLVKSSYVAGLIRPDLLIETLFSTPSSFHTAEAPASVVDTWHRVHTIMNARKTLD